MEQFPLKEHQIENIDWIKDVKRGLLADQPGLGKSRSAIEALDGAESVLIVAPRKIVTMGVWQEEINRWASNPGAFQVAPFSMLNDRKKTGKGSATKPLNKLRPEFKGRYDAIVIDEAHNIKGRGNYWTWAVQDIAKRTEYAIPMTGTPIPNWAHELFTLLQVIHGQSKPGEKYGSFWRWAEEWFDTSPTRWSNGQPVVGEMLGCTPACKRRDVKDPCKHYIKFTQANLGERWMRHLRDDCLDLPPLNIDDVLLTFDNEAHATYKELKINFAADYQDHEILAWSQGELNVMLDRLTVSPWMLHKQGVPTGGKFDLLRKDLSKFVGAGEQVLVMAHYRDVVEASAQVASEFGSTAYVHGGMTDSAIEKAVAGFKKGKHRVLVGSLETMAEGITLTMANTAIFMERSFKPSRNEQATYRIHRMGQERECTVRRYITKNSVDSKKERLLTTKTDHQMRTMTAAEYKDLL